MSREIRNLFYKLIQRRRLLPSFKNEHGGMGYQLPDVRYGDGTPLSQASCFVPQQRGLDSYEPVLLGRSTLSDALSGPELLKDVIGILALLEPDDYLRYTMSYYREGMKRFGGRWRYADITTALLGLSRLLKPESYMEIGVRRGRSMAIVAGVCPDCSMVGFDLWIENYAGMPNPGSGFVRQEMSKVGHRGKLELIRGNSHETVKQYFREHPDAYFDLITVDGDHSLLGAAEDLADALPRLKIGGAVVFDDIIHPKHRYLYDLWQHFTGAGDRFTTWEFDELGYGVAVGIRKF